MPKAVALYRNMPITNASRLLAVAISVQAMIPSIHDIHMTGRGPMRSER
jgi:hypothetical protein